MKVYRNLDQGSGQWFQLRQGIPTASQFHLIITPTTGKLSAQSAAYAYRLAAERLLNAPSAAIEGQEWMDRGKELEPVAARHYEFVHEVETEPVAFVTTDDGAIGASPDRLVKGRPIGLEIKCPSPPVHLRYLLDGCDDKYRPQVQGQIYVAELERADFLSYHPRMPARLISTPRDEPFIALLKAALDEFNAHLAALVERARALGVFQAYEAAQTPTELEHADALGAALRDELDPRFALREA